VLTDLRYALRSLSKSPGFTIVALLTLGLGIGANTAIFSVLYGVLLRPLPYTEPDRLVGLTHTIRENRSVLNLTHVQFEFLRQHQTMFEPLAASASVGFNLAHGTAADRVRGLRVSRDYFRTLGVAPQLGRAFLEEEDQLHAPGAIILSHGLWQRRFGGDPTVVGRTIALDGAPATVVGVMPAGFRSVPDAEAWAPLAPVGPVIGGGSNLNVIARLRPGLSLAQASAAMDGLTDAFLQRSSGWLSPETRLGIDPYRLQVASDYFTPVRVLFGAVGLVLLIACANVASLMLGRAAARSRELGVRTALGASRSRLMRQLLTESAVLALAGGAVGLLLAGWGLGLLLALVPAGIPATTEIRLDLWALTFALGLSLVTGLACGIIPAWHVARSDLHRMLKDASPRTIGTVHHGRLRHVLVAGEIAVSLVLLVGAGLMIRTFARLLDVDPGFDPRNVIAGEMWLTGTRYDSPAGVSTFYRELTSRLEALPGVRSAAVVEAGLPLQRGGNVFVLVAGEGASVDYRSITAGYFTTLGIALRDGREFTVTDRAGAAPVVMVNATFARRFFSDGPAVGRTLQVFRDGAALEVIGVVDDVRSFVGFPPPPTVFLPAAQTPAALTRLFGSWFPTHVVVRAATDAATLRATLPRVVSEIDPSVPVGQVRTMDEVLTGSLASRRFPMVVLSVFAGLAILLAAVGLYGVISYLVAQRTHEIGVRIALGAEARDVVRMVLGRGLVLTGVGSIVGVVAALALTRVLESQLFGVQPTDPFTFAGVTALLGLVALMASWLPAYRAARLDPMEALRYE
jgi:predicted permease